MSKQDMHKATLTRAKVIDIISRMLREQLPLMTNLKISKCAYKVIGILEAYDLIKPYEEDPIVSKKDS